MVSKARWRTTWSSLRAAAIADWLVTGNRCCAPPMSVSGSMLRRELSHEASRKAVLFHAVKRFHLVFGLVVLIVFLLTGQYMDRYHNHLEFMADGPRLLYRTRHIFILMSGLLHLGIGTYFSFQPTATRRADRKSTR